MTKAELIAKVEKGKAVLVGEYRGSSAGTVNFTDKRTGKAASFKKVVHIVEIDGDSLHVNERVGEDYDVVGHKQFAYAKGSRVAVELTGLRYMMGLANMQGILYPYSG